VCNSFNVEIPTPIENRYADTAKSSPTHSNVSGYRDPTNPSFIQLKTSKCNESVEYNLLKTMHKFHLESSPNNLQNKFAKKKSIYELKGTEVFTKPRFQSAAKGKCVTIKGVSLWNSLDCKINTSKSIYVFKKYVKLSTVQKYTAE